MTQDNKIIAEIVDEAKTGLDGWFGPNGQTWCSTQNKFVDPGQCNCPECQELTALNNVPNRYLYLHAL